MTPQEEALIAERIQVFIDKATNTANEIATRAVGRVIEVRDKSLMTLEVAKEEVAAAVEKIAANRKELLKFRSEFDGLLVEVRGLKDDISYLRSHVSGLTTDAKAISEVIGKVVALKSEAGAMKMTAAAATEDGLIQCVWTTADNPMVHSMDIPLAALRVIQSAP